MKESDVRARAFAMPLTSPAFPPNSALMFMTPVTLPPGRLKLPAMEAPRLRAAFDALPRFGVDRLGTRG